jgi:predicted nucleotide-binding protein (sugar kinase/HSP70/actin superfamily)
MSYGGARCMAAAFQSVGLRAVPAPDSDSQTLELGGRFTSGDECLPERITLGDFIKVTLRKDFDPKRTAFFMPTSGGPCRFGQYGSFIQKVMRQLGHEGVIVFSPTSANNYADIGDSGFVRTGWRALVMADLLQKLVLKTRPYEVTRGETDAVHEESLTEACRALSQRTDHKRRLKSLVEVITRARDRFRRVALAGNGDRPLIGIVGEIFCRHHSYSNENLIRKVEEHGGEAWLSDLTEWVWYTGSEERRNLRLTGRRFSKAMLGNWIRRLVQRRDEHALAAPLQADFQGREEPSDIETLIRYSEPYLPVRGSLGEMVLNVGKSIYLYKKGAHGVIDISPFTCMNGIISEAIYPHLSRDHGGFPIRSFYFDGTAVDLDRDVGIFIELARNYQRKKAAPAPGTGANRSHSRR